MAVRKPSEVLRSKHCKVCEALDISDTALRSLTTRLFTMQMIDQNTKASILRKMGYEGADKLMDMLEMKVDARPDRLQPILEAMVQEQSLRDVFESVIEVKDSSKPVTPGNGHYTYPTPPIPVTINQPHPPPNPVAPAPHQLLDSEGIDKLRRLIMETIEGIYDKLHNATSGALPDLTRKLYEEGLVVQDVVTKPDYNSMMKSFFATLEWDTTLDDLEKDCAKFIKALFRLGGPARKAGEKISSDLKTAVKEKLGFDFKTP